MKKFFKYTFLTAVGAIMAGTAVSCSDETDAVKDKGATPVIKYARPTDINVSDSLLVSAPLGARVVFVGDNLGDVQQVWFNDQKAKLNPTMVTSHTVIVDIPNNIPGEVTGQARFITSTGIEVSYPFGVTVPAPRIDKLSCEWAKPGDAVTITGAYFADDPNVPLTVEFVGGGQATIRSLDQEALTVVVPEGSVEGPVTVTSIYGSTESSFNYKDTRGMLFDFEPDGITGLGTAQSWHARPVVEDEHSLSGMYMIIGNGSTPMSAAGDWNDSDYSFEYWAGSWNTPTDYPERVGERLFDIVDFTDYSNLALKFELQIPSSNAWQAGAMQVFFSPSSMCSFGNSGTDCFGNTVAGCNNTFFQSVDDGGYGLARYLWTPWTAAEAYHTNDQWITVVMPIKDFVYDPVGNTPAYNLGSYTDFANLDIFIWGGGVEGVECTPLFYIDNIRVVPNN